MHVRVPAVFVINSPPRRLVDQSGTRRLYGSSQGYLLFVRLPRIQTLSSFNYQSRYLRGRHVGVSRRRTDADKKSHGEEKAVHRIRR